MQDSINAVLKQLEILLKMRIKIYIIKEIKMARPKLKNRDDVKIKINLTITPKQREKLYELTQQKNISASELLGKWIEKDFKALEKKMQKEKAQ